MVTSMNNAAETDINTVIGLTITTSEDTLTITGQHLRLVYSSKTDERVECAIDGKVWARDAVAAEELAREMRAWGVSIARAYGNAVVFWG